MNVFGVPVNFWKATWFNFSLSFINHISKLRNHILHKIWKIETVEGSFSLVMEAKLVKSSRSCKPRAAANRRRSITPFSLSGISERLNSSRSLRVCTLRGGSCKSWVVIFKKLDNFWCYCGIFFLQTFNFNHRVIPTGGGIKNIY